MNVFDRATDTLFRNVQLGEQAEYTPNGGSAVSVRVIVTQRGEIQSEAGPIETQARQRIAQVRRAEIESAIGREPQGRDQIIVSAGTFEVDDRPQLSTDGRIWELGLIEPY